MAPGDQKRTHLNLKVPPAVKEAIQRFADKEERSPGNLATLLLKWGAEQLEIAGDTVVLLSSHIALNPAQAAARQAAKERRVFDGLSKEPEKKGRRA